MDEAALSAELKRLVVHDEDTGYWMLARGQAAGTGSMASTMGASPAATIRGCNCRPGFPATDQRTASAGIDGRPSLDTVASAAPQTPPSVESSINVDALDAQALSSSAILPRVQRMLFVGAAGTLGALLVCCSAYIVGFFCRAGTSSGN